MIKPKLEDFPEFYRRYIEKVIDTDILKYLEEQRVNVIDFFNSIDEEKANYRYAPEKWSIKQLLGHIIDTERILTCRALQFARDEQQELPGFDEDDYVKHANFDELSLSTLINEFDSVRKATITLYKSFNDVLMERKGKANGVNFTPLSIVYILAGHIEHHKQVIKERYLK